MIVFVPGPVLSLQDWLHHKWSHQAAEPVEGEECQGVSRAGCRGAAETAGGLGTDEMEEMGGMWGSWRKYLH